MRRRVLIVALLFSLVGCHSRGVDRLLGNSDDSSTGTPRVRVVRDPNFPYDPTKPVRVVPQH